MMKVKAILPWYGGKRTGAPRIVRELGKHTQYFEPAMGSAAVLFQKEPTQKETVNDLHGDLTNLAMVVQSREHCPELYDRVSRVIVSEALLNAARQQLQELPWRDFGELTPDRLKPDRAYWYFVACWIARNGTAGTSRMNHQIAVRWTKGGGSPTVRWAHVVESIPAWHKRLQNVVILNRDLFTFIHKLEDVKETAIYVDPPYPLETRSTSGGGRYLHDFPAVREPAQDDTLFAARPVEKTLAERGDKHAALADALRKYENARIVVSTYECERYRDLYKGWTFVECPVVKNMHNAGKRGEGKKKMAPEVLIINGPSFTEN